jgi:hypothetical protein
MSREFAEKPQVVPGLFVPQPLESTRKSKKFPVFSLMIREFDAGEHFASDCVIRQPVRDFRRFCKPVASRDFRHTLQTDSQGSNSGLQGRQRLSFRKRCNRKVDGRRTNEDLITERERASEGGNPNSPARPPTGFAPSFPSRRSSLPPIYQIAARASIDVACYTLA